MHDTLVIHNSEPYTKNQKKLFIWAPRCYGILCLSYSIITSTL